VKIGSAKDLICDGENSETDSSLDFARDCNYISTEQHKEPALAARGCLTSYCV